MSIQGFLRIPGDELNENYGIKLANFDELSDILEGITSIFLDEREANIIGECSDVDEVIITNGSHGSRIISKDCETKIDAVKCDDIKDSTGCGDTYMAAYIAKRLNNSSIKDCGDFASKIASEKLKRFGHY